ncbi:Tfp pilus assembly protein ATPase PilM-like protein [Thermocrinis albus DSM 14484]|uniref:Tfp pilus assembly protein ATPase PilM-like protein n=1 Tax=Thermocrinis albus (strain DSM 14484 / JCM 11386 / HI 11/12) TaxID=638303 RepID=D3SNE9_THEAH|nr:pilus assembly protein PilM [Thermocrinis albus]ADC88686.1 Tfp pilus assembly protein ATPase PilM-like protein [Thermocrinis albus DSM 14484]
MKLALSLPKIKLPSLKKGKVGLSLQIGSHYLRLLELSPETQKPLWEPVEVLFDVDDPEEKIKVLRDLVNKHSLSGKEVIAALSVDEALLKFYRYPSTMSEKDLKNAISWAVSRELSTIKEPSLYDYYVLKPSKDRHYMVLLCIAREESVKRLQGITSKAGLKLKILDYEVLALINYGLYFRLPESFSILYTDWDYSILTIFSPLALSYSVIHWSLRDYLKNRDEEYLESFFTEVRNYIVINDLSNVYLAGVALSDEDLLESILGNLPVLGILDISDVKPSMLVPYMLSLRGVTE